MDTHRDIFFNCIADIKYTAIYGGMVASRLDRIGIVIDSFLAFVLSGAFCSFWIWQGHPKTIATIMLVAAFLQMLSGKFSLCAKAARIRAACKLLNSLYIEARDKWRGLDMSNAPDEEYQKCSAYFDAREKDLTDMADADIVHFEGIRSKASAIMESQLKFDFH
ncbi:MAG: hypothetical protein IJS08_12270 [Victivallales bacterium]|nr:hypothetical protein [Victivallales bacterium]